MRILHIGKFYPPDMGGMETYLRDLAEHQARQGHEVAVLVHAGEHSRPGTQSTRGVRITRVKPTLTASFAPVAPAMHGELRRLVKKHAPHLIHLHMPNTAALWLRCSVAARRVPWVITWHADVLTDRWSTSQKALLPGYRWLERSVLHRAAAVMTTSEPYQASSAPLQPASDRCRVVPLGMDVSRLPEPDQPSLREAQAFWPSQPGGLRLLNIGRLTYYKGQSHLIELMKRVPDAVLCIAGGGELESELKSRAKEAGVAARVQFLGRIDESLKHALLATCDVFVLPSIERTEAFGLVLLEAARHGKPAVAFDIPGSGVGYAVQHEHTGLLVPVGNDEALAAAVARLRDDPALRERLGTNAKARFEKAFTIQANAAGVQRVYDEVLNQ